MRSIDTQLTKDKVVAELRRAILFGNYKVGEELYQDKLAEQLGVSRLPVREALQILHNEGLITVKPNKVAYVNEVSTKFLHDHFSMRSMLEKEAVRLAFANRIDPALLRALYEGAEDAIARGDFRTFDDYNHQFHAAIWQAANNVVLERLLAQLWNTVIFDALHAAQDISESNGDHLRIIEALEAQDVKRAMELVGEHVNRSYSRVLQQIEGQGTP